MKRWLLIVALLGILVGASPASAGKTRPYLQVTPSAPTVGSSFTISGCGYTRLTTIIVWHNYTGPYQEVTPDANGCVSATFSPFGIDPTGLYQAQSWESSGGGWRLSSEIDFTVT